MEISSHICQLLYHHNCVIIPGFGGFVAEYCPARIHATQHIFSPPSKAIAFNINLNNNDGLLVNAIAENEKISFDKSLEKIKDFVNYCLSELKKGNKITLKNIGQFSYDVEQNMQFVPAYTENFLMDSYGLISFQSNPIKRETIDQNIRNDRPSIPLPSHKLKKISKYFWFAAVPFILLITAIIYDLNFNSKSFITNQSNLNPLSVPQKTTSHNNITELKKPELDKTSVNTVVADSVKDVSQEIEPQEIIKNTIEIPIEINNTLSSEKPEEKNMNTSEEGKYHIIGGAFSLLSNAEKLVAKMTMLGFDSKIIDITQTGLHRVSFGSFKNKSKAKEILSMIKAEHQQDAWLLVKAII